MRRPLYFAAVVIFFFLWPPDGIGQAIIVTGSIARSANLPVFSLLRGRFLRFFAPQGRHVALMGVKFGTEEGTEGPLLRVRGPLLRVPSSVPNFTPIGATTRV